MHQVTRFVANDGAMFTSEAEALKRDALLARCAVIAQMLPPHNDDRLTRVKHNPKTLSAYRAAIFVLCRELYPKEDVFNHDPEEVHPFSWAGRFLSEAAPQCINSLWWRLSCISDGYEYQQPFYALNPDKFGEHGKPKTVTA